MSEQRARPLVAQLVSAVQHMVGPCLVRLSCPSVLSCPSALSVCPVRLSCPFVLSVLSCPAADQSKLKCFFLAIIFERTERSQNSTVLNTLAYNSEQSVYWVIISHGR